MRMSKLWEIIRAEEAAEEAAGGEKSYLAELDAAVEGRDIQAELSNEALGITPGEVSLMNLRVTDWETYDSEEHLARIIAVLDAAGHKSKGHAGASWGLVYCCNCGTGYAFEPIPDSTQVVYCPNAKAILQHRSGYNAELISLNPGFAKAFKLLADASTDKPVRTCKEYRT